MKLASAVLATPALVNGRTSRELEADGHVGLIANFEKAHLEIYVDGRLIRLRHLAGVIDMVPAEKQETCPECALRFDDARALAGHRRHKHGVKGATR